MATDAKSKPAFEFRAGNIKATAWNNTRKIDDREVVMSSVTITRSYKDNDGNWQNSQSFGREDLPKVALVTAKCYEKLMLADKGEAV